MTDSVLSLFGAERRAATCSICGQAARPGAKLCAQCKAALKRARHDPVSQLEPLPRKSHAASDAGRRKSHRRPDIAVGIEPPAASVRARRRRRLPSLLVVSGIAAAAIGVAATIVRHDAGLALPALLPLGPSAPPVSVPAPKLVPLPLAGAAVVPPPPSAVLEAPAPLEPRAAPPKPAAPAARAKPAAPAVATAVDPVSAFGAVAEAAPPAPVAVPAPPPPAAPAPDRWQQMTDAIARCGRGEDFIDRVVCEQRARLAACDGYWGQVPQCPSGIPNDHGQ